MLKVTQSAYTNQQSKCIVHLSKRTNKRLVESAALKFKRNLKWMEQKAAKTKIDLDPPSVKFKESISQSIQFIEGKDVIRKKKEILNKTYLESISEIISLHDNYEQLPRLNINSVEISDNLLHLKIFWSFNESDVTKIEFYHKLLVPMIPDIKKSLQDNYYIHTAPDITFVYDSLDGLDNEMEFLFGRAKEQIAKSGKEPFDISKLFDKEKVIKKEFDIRSVVVRDPSVDYPVDEKWPTKFKHPYEMNLFMCNLDFKKIYESVLFKVSQGKGKRTLNKNHDFDNDETRPSPYVQAPIFKHSDLNAEKYDLPLTDDRVKLMKTFVIANKKKAQRESREYREQNLERLDKELDEKLESKQRMESLYRD